MNKKHHDIQDLDFRDNMMILTVDGQTYHIPIDQASNRLAQATDRDRVHYCFAPSGYGIHWPTLDEDLSIKGLLKLAIASQSRAS